MVIHTPLLIKFNSINFTGNYSKTVKKIIKKVCSNITVATKNNCNIYKNLSTKIKDKMNFKEFSNIVYQINCLNCEKIYIGETKQKLMNRVRQHELDLFIKDLIQLCLPMR